MGGYDAPSNKISNADLLLEIFHLFHHSGISVDDYSSLVDQLQEIIVDNSIEAFLLHHLPSCN